MEEIYDEEIDKIKKLGRDLQEKYNYIVRRFDPVPMAKKNRELLTIWHDEVLHRYHQLGFVVLCDITPALSGLGTPSIEIVDRIKQISQFDIEKKGWEVTKHREDGTEKQYKY